MINEVEASAPRAVSDLSRAQPADATTKNLLGLLDAKLDLCARLPVFEWEADREGWADCAAAFRRIAENERLACTEVLDALRTHLQRQSSATPGARA